MSPEKKRIRVPITKNTLINALVLSIRMESPGEEYSFKYLLFKICKPLVQSCYVYLASTLKMDAPSIKAETIDTFYELTRTYDPNVGVYFLIYIKKKLYPLVKYHLVKFLKGNNRFGDVFDDPSLDVEEKKQFNWGFLLNKVKDKLGDLYADILLLRYLFGLTQEEIGSIMKVSQVVVFSHLKKIYGMFNEDYRMHEFVQEYGAGE